MATREQSAGQHLDFKLTGTSWYAHYLQAKEFKELLDEILRLVVTPIFGDMIPYLGFLDSLTPYKKQMRKAHLRLEAFFGRVIQEHREYLRSAGQGKVAPVRDILDVMLSLADGAQTTGIQLDDDKIKGAIFVSIFKAYHMHACLLSDQVAFNCNLGFFPQD